ncbi:MAG: serine hydrolase [Pseudomonadota bacterium]
MANTFAPTGDERGGSMRHQMIDRRSMIAGASAGAALIALPARANGSFEAATTRAASLDQLRALVIATDGEMRLARAFRGPAPDRPVNVKSVSKTLVALLTGVAIREGAIAGVDTRLAEVAPDLIPRGADPMVESITVAHLVTMTAGLQRTSGAFYGEWVQSRNWVAYALSRRFVAEPGARFQYSTGAFHLLGAVLARATGRDLHALARDWLGRPLGIEIPPWTRDPQGFYMGGNNMALSPLALARIGETVRMGGAWQGRAVIPAAWIEASWRPRTRSPFSGDQYGYGWFLKSLGGTRAVYARGYGGQMLYVLPDAGLTVAVTSDPTRPARTHGHVGDLHRLVARDILPAVAG